MKTGRLEIIAEIGSIHDGSIGNALKAIDAAAEAGASIVKFQTHIAEAETLLNAPSPTYFQDESRFDYFSRTSFNHQQWIKISRHCEKVGVGFLSSPFSLEAVQLLESINVGAYKIPSGEVSNLPLLERIAKTGKPTFLSSGMSDWIELDSAVRLLKPHVPLTVMQCSSMYPCPPSKVGLNVIDEMNKRYQLPVGFSDHSLGLTACIAAVTLGASSVEKHFTFSRKMYGSDASLGMEPDEFKNLCSALRELEIMLESPVDKNNLTDFFDMRLVFQKSIVLKEAISAGTILAESHLAFKKPGDGIPAGQFRDVIGRRLQIDKLKDAQLKWEDLS